MVSDRPTRLLFTTQSTGLRIFWQLYKALTEAQEIEDVGFFVTNRVEYRKFLADFPDFEALAEKALFEWDLMEEARNLSAPDTALIERMQSDLNVPTFWPALISDRRLTNRLKAQFVQDYEAPYDHETLLKILTVALRRQSAQFARIRPDAVIGLNAVTVYDYLYSLMAKSHGIPYFQLKLTRVENHVCFFTDPFEVSPNIAQAFDQLQSPAPQSENLRDVLTYAQDFIDRSRNNRLIYEGAIYAQPKSEGGSALAGKVSGLGRKVKRTTDLLITARQNPDPHYPAALSSLVETRIVKPLRRAALDRAMDVKAGEEATFASENAGKYALFPLNTEPEVALLAYGRPYRNQIETVRNLAASLPVTWKLVVKEHPNARGYRSAGYYQSLKAIPNVVLAAPSSKSGPLMDHAGFIALVYGTIGLEALIRRKPVLSFTRTPYGIFPPNMVHCVTDLWSLPDQIAALLDHHEHDEQALVDFVAAHVMCSVRANLFTQLLNKSGRESPELSASIEDQYRGLAREALRRLGEEQARQQGQAPA